MTVCPGYDRLVKFEVLEEIMLKENRPDFVKKKFNFRAKKKINLQKIWQRINILKTLKWTNKI